MKVKFFGVIFGALIGPIIFTASAAALGPYTSGSVGADVSWPNCSARQPNKTDFGVVGVTGGKGFSPNSCLAKQVGWFKNPTLYVNTGYPGVSYSSQYQNSPKNCSNSDLNCIAYNYGYNAGLYAVNYANTQGVNSKTWWLDVETMNTWMSDTAQNIQSLQGEIDALKINGVINYGVYSTTYQWNTITGNWQNGLPNWGATTWRTAKQAASFCTGHNFTGGPTWLMQFIGSLDQDYAC